MDEQIQFGEVEQAAPERALRPDENGSYVVVSCGEPLDYDLPIFIELDVLRDMEAHAKSDMSVELGGVMLGGRYLDQNGRSFVVIRESLRAEHYESTKGSFKFTHDTWSAIARQRAVLPADLQMVGWYHTHPGWGVFLSGMDTFICESFFNQTLDVAFVIDPCQLDRGMFQWAVGSREPLRRTGGFFVIASRFRGAELANFVAELHTAMPISTQSLAGPTSAPIIHVHQPPMPPWQGTAFAVALALQTLLLALLILWTFAPASAPPTARDVQKATSAGEIAAGTQARQSAELRSERLNAQAELLDAIVRELKGTETGFVTRLQERFDHTAKLTDDVAARDALLRELRTHLEGNRRQLADLESATKQESARLQSQIANLTAQNEQLRTQVATSSDVTNPNATQVTANSSNPFAQAPVSTWWWAIGAVVVAAVALVIFTRSRTQETEPLTNKDSQLSSS